MRKTALLLALVLVLCTPVTAYAATRVSSIKPSLGFSGTAAICQVTVMGDNASQHIQVTMKLMYGTIQVASWSGSGYGYVYLDKSATVFSGRTYTLVVEVTMDGVVKDPVYITKTC